MDLFFQNGTTETIDPPLGYSFVGFDGALITESIAIKIEKQFPYYNKRFLKALNSGQISQTLYDAIIDNQNEARQVYELNSDIDLDKGTILTLVEDYGIDNVNNEGTIAEIVEDIINEGYQIIKKI